MLPVLAVLVLAVVGTPFVGQAIAAFDASELFGYIPGTVIVVEPKNITYVDVIPLNVVVSNGRFDPDSDTVFARSPLWISGYSYSIDGQDNVSIAVGESLNRTLTDLESGDHYIICYSSFYVAWGQLAGPYVEYSEPVYFSVITIQEPQNKTYHTKDVPLIFTIDRPVPLLTYSLDNEAKITITENTTLSSLPYGSHKITIYADETATSRTIYFNKQVSPILILSISSATAITIGSIVVIYKKRTALT